jgi:Fe-S-cluster-containing dehydrogenase component/anaerobic selenocysteine-containing dehydrogenase
MPSLSGRDWNRRHALKLLASSMAATLARCSRPDEEIVPYANMPEGLVAGEPMRFATSLSLSGYGRGFLIISVDGRPIKVEGNPLHPFSLGATDIFAEAEVLSLYNPDRATVVRHRDQISTWEDFSTAWTNAVSSMPPDKALAVVTGRITSPITLSQIDALRQQFATVRHYRYEPIHDDASRSGSRLAFGRVLTALPRWGDADVIVSLAADPLGPAAERLRTARAYAERRGQSKRQRIYVAEPQWTLTGAAADIRLALGPEALREVARAIANALGANLGEPKLSEDARHFVQRAAGDLSGAHGRAFVLAGEALSPDVHALCHWINGELNAPIHYLSSQDNIDIDHAASLSALIEDLHARQIGGLIVADANPVYDAPETSGLAGAIATVPISVYVGLHRNETAAVCRWHLPLSHPLESWGAARSLDGTLAFVQPLIQRLYHTRTLDEVLAFLGGSGDVNSYDLTRAVWRDHADGDFDNWWQQALQNGIVKNTNAQPVPARVANIPELPPDLQSRGLTLTLSPDPSVWDGRYADNAWLQECPKPFTKQVWGNAVEVSPADARRFGISNEDTVELTVGDHTATTVALVVPGQADGVLAAPCGMGRSIAGRIGTDIGARFGGLSVRPLQKVLSVSSLRKSAQKVPFLSTQLHTRLAGRAEDLFRVTTLIHADERESEPSPASLLGIPPRGEYAWAMVIDTDNCIGCNACVVACQAENNVPVVGPQEIALGRDMHWLRIDSYEFSGTESTRRGFQPVPCMHCELAPCEPVCPVEASVHDHEGLNVQVYNRCIGTRFCEANCPYKVRRFNWFDYAGDQAYANEHDALKAQHNPDVSVRPRGVMEKCNYCLQRISRARKTAEKENREVLEGEVVTACQAACPTRAIHFGDINRGESDVSKLRTGSRHYTLLAELNTRPRTTYLERVYNSDEES